MASVRELKRDVNFLTSELALQAHFSYGVLKLISDKEFDELISEIIKNRDSLIARINNPDGKNNPKLLRGYFKKIRIDMVSSYGNIAQKFNGGSK